MDKVRFGIVGTGGIGHHHMNYFKELKRAELTCVCDIKPDLVKRVGQERGVPAFAHPGELIASGLCDAIIIGTPHYAHATVGIAAMNAGLHVLTEKPMTVQTGMADRMIEAARKNKVKLAVMFQRRTDPLWKKAKSIIVSGALGELQRTCMIEPHYRTQAYYDSGDWRATWVGEGGGVMMNQAPHSLDAFVWLGGMPSKVVGKTATRGHRIEVEDCASALLTYPNGATGYLTTSTCEYPGTAVFQFVGDKAVLELRDNVLRIGISAPGAGEYSRTTSESWGTPQAAWSEVKVPQESHGHRFITQNFIDALLDGAKIIAPPEEAILSLELANAITVSSELGREVDIPLRRKLFDDVLKKFIAASKAKAPEGSDKKITLPKVTF
jgi:predicted dehydrogenase